MTATNIAFRWEVPMHNLSDYERGFIDALTAYAHWQDGVQYVGTCGTTLKDAVESFLVSRGRSKVPVGYAAPHIERKDRP